MSCRVTPAHAGFGLPPPGSGVLMTLPAAVDDAPVHARERNSVARLQHGVLRLAVQLRVPDLEIRHLLTLMTFDAVLDRRAVIEEVRDRRNLATSSFKPPTWSTW